MTDTNNTISKGARIAGWIMSILPVLLLLMSASFKFIQPGPDFANGVAEMGWTPDQMFRLGFVEIRARFSILFPERLS